MSTTPHRRVTASPATSTRSLVAVVLAAMSSVSLLACGSSQAGEPDPYHFNTASGALHVDLQTNPEPPAQGTNTAMYTVTDANGAPVDGLDLSVVPWMPAMGHGSEPLVTSVTPQGNGVYAVTNVVFFMPGLWELRTTFSGQVSDRAAPQFQVP